MTATSLCLALLLGVVAALQDDEALVTTLAPSIPTFAPVPPVTYGPTPISIDNKDDGADVYSLHVTSHIQYRYASTVVSSRVANTANISKEVVFSFVLPETAFITGFLMEVDGKVYKAGVKEKEAAKKEYDDAIKGGQTAGHVAQSARNSDRFTVSVNIEAQKKVTFNLTYEELLKRTLSKYNHAINIDPGQIVLDMAVEVQINESSPITSLEVTNPKESNEIDYEKSSNNPLAKIQRPSPNTATIRWAPSTDDQRELNEEGVKGQLVVRYDVNRSANPDQILVNEGYFVHFFSPEDLPTLRKHVTFVMDVSGSMAGRKIEQLREAMKVILDDLNEGDFFSLVVFSTDVQVWDPEHELVVPQSWNSWYSDVNKTDSQLSPAAVVPATPDNIKKAQEFVKNLQSYYSTNIYDALLKGLELAHLGRNLTGSGSDESKPEPIMIFLTDGEANVGESDPEKIVGIVTDKNGAEGVSIFGLEFGDYANSKFLKKLSLRNSGFSRKIYEASDSAIQLRDFYRLVSSPLLAKVSFNYPEGQVEEGTLSQTNFSAYFSGSELVVAGKLKSADLTGHVTAKTSNGTTSIPFPHPIVVPFPDWELAAHHRPERNYSDASFMERLWAYLTIQQLLEKETAETLEGTNVTSPSKQKALDLALKYGFVTPLTSLVVVKPNGTVSAGAEKGDAPGNSFGNNVYSFGAPQAALAGVADRIVGGAGGSFVASSFGGAPGRFPPPPAPPMFPAPSNPFQPALSTMAPSWYPSTTATLPLLPQVIPLYNLTWLAAVSNSTHITLPSDPSSNAETLLLGLNQTDEAFSYCSSPVGPGHCRYLPHCTLDSFANNVSEYIPYHCKIDGYAGVCCPDQLKPITVV